jgi:hypothetical protein
VDDALFDPVVLLVAILAVVIIVIGAALAFGRRGR